MKLRNSVNSGSGASAGGGINLLEFQAMKDSIWRLTCRVVSLESEISDLRDSLGISENIAQDNRQTRNRRNYQTHSTENSGLGIDPGEILAVELNQEQNADGEILAHSFTDSEQEEADAISNDSNYTPKKPEKPKVWNPVKRQRRTPRFGPDGKREKDFECEICQRKFTRNEHLQDHFRTHQGKTFSCMTCGSTFAYKNALRRHEKHRCKIKITMEELTCKLCNKIFGGKKNLGIHMRVHSEKKLKVKLEEVQNSVTADAESTTEISGTVGQFVDNLGENEYKADYNHHMHQIIEPEIGTTQIEEPECVPVITSSRSIEHESIPVISAPQLDFTHMIQL